jgi:NAD(P)-dependent dehydrogenase (short-subunit alcohol dehydrogenase family)
MLHNKVVVISGGFGYLGFAIAESFAKEGAKVIIVYNNTSPEEVSFKIESLIGTGHKSYKCNLSVQEETVSLFNAISSDFGSIDICVHTASLKPKRKKIISVTEKEMLEQFEGTIITSFNFLTTSAKALQEKGGVIIGITTSGIVVKEATVSMGAYIPAKYAVQGMLVALKEELNGTKTRVYSVAPGFMEGGMNNDIPKAFVEMIRFRSKTKTLITKEVVANTVVDICQNQEKYTAVDTILLVS